jgi:hypothetical protein
MLSINTKMLPRLDELEEDLLARRQRVIGKDGVARSPPSDRRQSAEGLAAERRPAEPTLWVLIFAVSFEAPHQFLILERRVRLP